MPDELHVEITVEPIECGPGYMIAVVVGGIVQTISIVQENEWNYISFSNERNR